MEKKCIAKIAGGVRGEIFVPGDKSISHRAVMFSSVCFGDVLIKNFLRAQDCLSTVSCMQKLGVEMEWRSDNELLVHGRGLYGLLEPVDTLDAGDSGTLLRLLLGLLAGQGFFSAFTGDAALKKRPMGRVTRPLQQMGAWIHGWENAEKLPLVVLAQENQLKAITYESPVASAQVKSAILLAGIYADGPTTVIEPYTSRDHTERMLEAMGAKLSRKGTAVTLEPPEELYPPQGGTIEVPGDISSAAFWLVAASIIKGSDVTLRKVGINETRTGILEVLKKMGADITLSNQCKSGGEEFADLRVRSAKLSSTKIGAEIMPRLIDEIPIIAVAALFAEGRTVISGAGELRVKETDRLQAIVDQFNKLAPGSVIGTEDGLIIEGGKAFQRADVFSYDDHRIAMALAIAGAAGEGVDIENPDCVDISYPEFYTVLQKLSNRKKLVVAIDGPAGAGKSTIAKLVAKELGYIYIDTGAMYRAVAYKTLKQKKAVTDELILSVVRDIDISLKLKADGGVVVVVDDQEVTTELRTPEVTAIVSQVAMLAPVREKLVDLQRKIADDGGIVMDGRDITSHVLPNADVKVFMTASIEERAKRRGREMQEKGYAVDYQKLAAEIAARDKTDSEREVSPLIKTEDSVLLDTTGMGIEEVTEAIMEMCR